MNNINTIQKNIISSNITHILKYIYLSYCDKKIYSISSYIKKSLSFNEIIILYKNIFEEEINDLHEMSFNIATFYVKLFNIYASLLFSFMDAKELLINFLQTSNKDIYNLEETYYDSFDYINNNYFIFKLKELHNTELSFLMKTLHISQDYNNINSFKNVDLKEISNNLINAKIDNNNSSIENNTYIDKDYYNYINSIHHIFFRLTNFKKSLELLGENIISNNDFNKYIKNNDLQELVNDTRNTIVSFYINYETEYSLYLKYYQKLIEQRIKNIIILQIENINTNIDLLLEINN